MTSDFYFTATSWFQGIGRVKPHSKHSEGVGRGSQIMPATLLVDPPSGPRIFIPSTGSEQEATSWCRQPEAKRRHPNSSAAAFVAAPRSVAHFLFGSISSIIVVISRLLVAPSSKKIAAIIGPREGSWCLPPQLCLPCPAAWLGQAARPHSRRQETLQEEEQLMSVWNLQVLLFTKVTKKH